MARGAAGDTVIVKPVNNVYTVLAAVAAIVVALGLVVVIMRGGALGIKFFEM